MADKDWLRLEMTVASSEYSATEPHWPWLAIVAAAWVMLSGFIYFVSRDLAVYSVLFTLSFFAVRALLSWVFALALMLPLTFLALWAIPQPSIIWTRYELSRIALPDVSMSSNFVVAGDLRTQEDTSDCGYLCRRLLLWPGVTSVTVDVPDPEMTVADLLAGPTPLSRQAVTYRLSRSAPCRDLLELGPLDANGVDKKRVGACVTIAPTLQRYNLLLRSGQLQSPISRKVQYFWFSSRPQKPTPGFELRYKEILRSDGRAVFRRHSATADAWAVPFRFDNDGWDFWTDSAPVRYPSEYGDMSHRSLLEIIVTDTTPASCPPIMADNFFCKNGRHRSDEEPVSRPKALVRPFRF